MQLHKIPRDMHIIYLDLFWFCHRCFPPKVSEVRTKNLGSVFNVSHSNRANGPAQNLSKFQMAPIPILSVLTCSTS